MRKELIKQLVDLIDNIFIPVVIVFPMLFKN